MFKKVLILLATFILSYGISSPARADTPVSGPITGDTIWTLANSPYIVEGDVTVNNGVTLTIEEGVEVRFNGNYALIVDGTLTAQGTVVNKIKFTSHQLIQEPGDWDRIYFRNGSSSSVLDYVDVEFGGSTNGASIYIETSSPSITNSAITESFSYPIECIHTSAGSTSPVLTNNTYSNNNPDKILITPNANRIFYDTTLTKDTIPYEITALYDVAHAQVNQTVTVTINPGVEVQFGQGAGLKIYNQYGSSSGAIDARGTETEPITFTSNLDNPLPEEYWAGLSFLNVTIAELSFIDHCVIEYAGGQGTGAVYIENLSEPLAITNSTIQNNINAGIYTVNGDIPITGNSITNNDKGIHIQGTHVSNISNNSFVNNRGYPVIVQHFPGTTTSPNLNNNTYSGNNPDGIHLTSDTEGNIYKSTTLTKDNAPYVVTEDINVRADVSGETAVVTMNPGVEVRFDPGFGMIFTTFRTGFAALNAQGTPSEQVVLTSNAVTRAPGDWKGLNFTSSTTGSLTNIDYLIIEYAGGQGTGAIYFNNVPEDFPITNSTFANNSNAGIHLTGTYTSDITNNTFTNNNGYGVVTRHTAGHTMSPNLINNVYNDNNLGGIHLTSDSENIYKSTTLTKDNTPYIVTEDLNVRADVTGQTAVVTINAGVEVHFDPGSGMNFTTFGSGFAALNVQGTIADPVVMTSNAEIPETGDWKGLNFTSSTTGSLTNIDYLTIEYAGGQGTGAIYFNNVPEDFPITNSTFANNSNAGIHLTGTYTSDITNNTFTNNNGYGVVTRHTAGHTMSPNLHDNTYSGNNPGGIHFTSDVADVYKSTTLTKDNTYYIVTKYLNVRADVPGQTAVVTMDPGIEVRFDSGSGMIFTTGGSGFSALNAQGTPGQPILLTSNTDTPAPGDWMGLDFTSSTIGSLTGIDYVIIEYTGESGTPAIKIDAVPESFSVTNSIIQNNADRGIYVRGTLIDITNNTFTNNGYSMEFDLDLNTLPLETDLPNNAYIGSSPGDIHLMTRSGEINYPFTLTKLPVPYIITDSIKIITAYVMGTMTVEPGATVKFGTGAGIDFASNATLSARGTPAEPIIFTSNATDPAPGDWKGFNFTSVLNPNNRVIELTHCHVEYAGGGGVPVVSISETAPGGTNLIDHSVFQNNLGEGIYINNSTAVITNNTLSLNNDGLAFENNSTVTASGNTISLNSNNGVYLNGTSVYPDVHVNNNTIEDNTNFNFYADGGNSGITVDARRNWWGSADPEVIAEGVFDNADDPLRPVVDTGDPLENGDNPISNVTVTDEIFDPHGGETTSITYDLSSDANITLKILDFDTEDLVRTLLDNVNQTAGPQSIVWDGKDDTLTIVENGIYTFFIEARDTEGDLLGEYNPSYLEKFVSATNITFTPTDFDPFKGDLADISYDLTENAIVTAEIGYDNNRDKDPQLTLFTDQIRTASTHTETWDGRSDSGNFVSSTSPFIAAIFPRAIPDNGIIVRMNSGLTIDFVEADPYIIHPQYSDVTAIEFFLSIPADVTVTIEDSSGNVLETLMNNESRGAGVNSVIWDGLNSSNEAVSDMDRVNIRVVATDPLTDVQVQRLGTVALF